MQVTLQMSTQRFTQRVLGFLARLTSDVDRETATVATNVLDDILTNWPVDTGVSRAAWSGPNKLGDAEYQLKNPIAYAPVIEYGGYPGVGPKTAAIGASSFGHGITAAAGIFPLQTPHAPVRRALAKNYGEMSLLMAKVLRHHWGRS